MKLGATSRLCSSSVFMRGGIGWCTLNKSELRCDSAPWPTDHYYFGASSHSHVWKYNMKAYIYSAAFVSPCNRTGWSELRQTHASTAYLVPFWEYEWHSQPGSHLPHWSTGKPPLLMEAEGRDITNEATKQWNRLPTRPRIGHEANTSCFYLSTLMDGKCINTQEHWQHVQSFLGNDYKVSHSHSDC